ncbi:uncharacterized protein LOC109604231 isoform X2 [Aethina tumida]|uniref:uncharacterized protein LOC109604231 isoform X2 n=1 Tax=Aethina tumida TaxID=116153 RepID=UPI0021493FA5|nr:uncharacterized protein LOC109604231 isoform X2 [Aethina tumida]
MSDCRVQKLLFSEFCDFDDMVLLESPFAQTTKDGTGIRQVHLGLTPSKLILATDVLPPVNENITSYVPGIDPEIETFELIAIYPVTCVNLSVYHRKRRQALKARFCNNKVLYFELGGFQKRKMFWNLWCEKVKFLSPEGTVSSKSETSVATSTTCSTLYLVDRKLVNHKGMTQLWCKFGPGDRSIDKNLLNVVFGNNAQQSSALVNKWTDKYLYLGEKFAQKPYDYKPIMYPPDYNNVVSEKPCVCIPKSRNKFTINSAKTCCDPLNGMTEGQNVKNQTDFCLLELKHPEEAGQFYTVLNCALYLDSVVHIWEHNKYDSMRYKVKHKRRYAFNPQSDFMNGLGHRSVKSGENLMLQLKRAASEIHLNHESDEFGFSRQHLISSPSCIDLHYTCVNNINSNKIKTPETKTMMLFWTPGYWYMPKPAKELYLDVRKHMQSVTEYLERTNKRKCKQSRSILRKLYTKENSKDSDDEVPKLCKKSMSRHARRPTQDVESASCCWPRSIQLQEEVKPEKFSDYMKKNLKLDMELRTWDFTSTILAQELTLIDKELFLKIPAEELGMVLVKRNTKSSPNISALLVFSHRISCLIAHEILKETLEKCRAKLIARFINLADKCHQMSNFQSCKTVMNGLQTPSIYRLKNTWAYVRKKHATKYQLFQHLSNLYRDPRTPKYQKMFFIMSQNTTFLPYIGDVLAKLFNKIPNYDFSLFNQKARSCCSWSLCTPSPTMSLNSLGSKKMKTVQNGNVITKFLNSIRMLNVEPPKVQTQKSKKHRKIKTFRKKTRPFKCLDDFYKPLYVIEDNRVQCLHEALEFLEKTQIGALRYSFTSNELARCYLLKARYKEEKDNFVCSLSIEPANQLCNKQK